MVRIASLVPEPGSCQPSRRRSPNTYGITRRADPQRIHQAKVAGTLASLIDQHRIPRDRAEVLIAAWEKEAERRGGTASDYWPIGQAWMLERRRA